MTKVPTQQWIEEGERQKCQDSLCRKKLSFVCKCCLSSASFVDRHRIYYTSFSAFGISAIVEVLQVKTGAFLFSSFSQLNHSSVAAAVGILYDYSYSDNNQFSNLFTNINWTRVSWYTKTLLDLDLLNDFQVQHTLPISARTLVEKPTRKITTNSTQS